ncbi:hypothetical protein HDU88_007161 [Geranomyces variabilis]|nr:hypothetical protein HDU88_007161 [Geranomyces variabilis]
MSHYDIPEPARARQPSTSAASTSHLYPPPPHQYQQTTSLSQQEPTHTRRRPLLHIFLDPHLRTLRQDPTCLVTSTVVSPRTLLYIRAAMLAWVLFLIPFSASRDGERYLFYFTQLTWCGLGLWLAVACFQTWRFTRDGNMDAFLRQNRVTQWLTWNLYAMPATYHWIVPIVFWALLSGDLVKNGKAYDWFVNTQVHAMDCVFIIIELVLNRIPLFYSQWPSVILTALSFLGYAFFQHAVYHDLTPAERLGDYKDGWWVYSFLDTRKAGAAVYYIALPIAFVLVFCLVVKVHKTRDRRRERKGRAVVGLQGSEEKLMMEPLGSVGGSGEV